MGTKNIQLAKRGKMRIFREFYENQELKQIAKRAKIDIDGLDLKQLQMGMNVEKEHDGPMGKDTDVVPNHDPGTIMKIAVAHLRENPKYYTKLKKIEEK